MKTLIYSICFLALTVQAYATTLYDQFVAFDPYWADHPGVLLGVAAKDITNDVDYLHTPR